MLNKTSTLFKKKYKANWDAWKAAYQFKWGSAADKEIGE